MKAKFIYWNGVFAVIIAIIIVVNCVAVSWHNVLRVFMGTVGGGTTETFESSSYQTLDELREAQEDFAVELMAEGSVILKNDGNALPLTASDKNISVFGQNSVNIIRGGTGSSAVSSGTYEYVNLRNVLEESGMSVNAALWNYYVNHEKRTSETGGDYNDYESTWTEMTAAEGVTQSFNEYSDAALVILSRLGSEAADLPAVNPQSSGGDGQSSYLALTPNEKDMLRGINQSGLFDKIIVVLNTGNAMQLDFLGEEAYGIDGCILFGMPGVYGIYALPDILTGKADPSGHLNDTYVTNSTSAPASRNFGDARYTNQAVSTPPSDTRSTTYEASNYGSAEYSFVNYGEGIYVGYRYYETRYEDTVLGCQNVGLFDYADEVVFPFGYGASYTTFEWSGFEYSVGDDGTVTVSVTVKNTGDYPGKDVVQIYYQAPYIEGGVEKSSVNLAEFVKTETIAPGDTHTVTASFGAKQTMKSYDGTCAVAGRAQLGAYVLDEGTYYITAAKDAHEAVNNILAGKEQDGVSVDTSKMTGAGNASFVGRYELDSREVLHTDDQTGAEIVNLFDDAVAPDANENTYLSRMNWAILDDSEGLKYATGEGYLIGRSKQTGEIVSRVDFETREAPDELIGRIQNVGWDASGRPESANDNQAKPLGQSNGRQLEEARSAEFDDEIWTEILANLTADDLKNSFLNGAFSTVEFPAIGKPPTMEFDGPSGITNYTNGHGGFGFPPTSTLGRSFNIELAEEYALKRVCQCAV